MSSSRDTAEVEVGFGFDFDENEEKETFEKDPFAEFENNETNKDPAIEEEGEDEEFGIHMNALTEKKKRGMWTNIPQGNEVYEDMTAAEAKKLIDTCKNKKTIFYCWDQIILKYTRELINNIIRKFQSYPEFTRHFTDFKAEFDIKNEESIENIFIYSHLAFISASNNDSSIKKYAIKLDENYIDKFDRTIYNKNYRIWYILIMFIDKIYKKTPTLANIYYNKIYFFLMWEEDYLKYKKSNEIYYWRKSDINNTLLDLVDATLSNDSILNFKLKNKYIRDEESIIKFLSSDCSDLIISDKMNTSTAAIYGGKGRTRRKHKKPKHFSKKGKKTSKRKCKKTLKRKHVRRITRRL